MATENQGGEPNEQDPSNGGEPNGGQGNQQDPTPGEGGNGGQQDPAEPVITKDTKIPDDHPLVKALARANQKVEGLAEAQAQAAKANKLEDELSKRPTQEALDTLQTRYDRLEAFLQEADGPLSRALDSRTFTRDLFESDKDISTLVKDWNKKNPSTTSQALGRQSGSAPTSETNMNDVLRAARKR